MKPKKIYENLLLISKELNIKIIQGKGNFKGGSCVYKEENLIVLNHNKPLEVRLKNLALSLLEFDLDAIEIDFHTKQILEDYSISREIK
tara:strand:+ start:18852 stop:19118 length:267 start_codon:yes stop_codon:yes gene_type:complete